MLLFVDWKGPHHLPAWSTQCHDVLATHPKLLLSLFGHAGLEQKDCVA
jgi:hypothetical protein